MGRMLQIDPNTHETGLLQSILHRVWARYRNASPGDQRMYELKRAVYHIGWQLIAANKERVAVALLSVNGTRRSNILSLQNNVFHHLMKCLSANPEYPTRAEKDRVAFELQYAWRHLVPDEHLIGFILAGGGSDHIRQTVESGDREPWFKKARARAIWNAAVENQTYNPLGSQMGNLLIILDK